MSQIDREKLALLETEFKDHPRGIELLSFVWLLKSTITYAPADEYRLMDGLVKLFTDIDINGNNRIEWHEFTQYIVDGAVTKSVHENGDYSLNDRKQQVKLAQSILIKEAFKSGDKLYGLRLISLDKDSFKQSIGKIVTVADDRLMVIKEENADKLRIVDSTLKIKNILEMPQSQSTMFNHQVVTVIDVAVNRCQGIIACATNDSQVFFWYLRDLQRLAFSKPFDRLVVSMHYLEASDLWALIDLGNCVEFWQLKTRLQCNAISCVEQHCKVQMHSDRITGLVEVIPC